MGVANEQASKLEKAVARIQHMKKQDEKQDDDPEVELPDYMKDVFEEE